MRMMKRTTTTLTVLSAIAVAAISISARANAATVALLMDGTGNGDPNQLHLQSPTAQGYPGFTPAEMQEVLDGYFNQDTKVAVDTPEELDAAGIPLQGTETLDASVAIGTQDINNAINQAIATNPPGTKIVVYGVSQSAIIVTEEKHQLLTEANPPPPDQLTFVVEGNLTEPDGGIVTRLPWLFTLTQPVIGISAYGAPPATPYNTIDVTEQYDFLANSPEYPLDVVAEANALAGYTYQHPDYCDACGRTAQQHPDLSAIVGETGTAPGTYIIPPTQGTLPPGDAVTGATMLAPNPDVPDGARVVIETNSAGGTDTYVLVYDQNLPLLQPLRQRGVPASIINPINTVLTPIVNAGYDPNSNPGVDTPAQLLPPPQAIAADVKAEGAAVASLAPKLPALPAATLRVTSEPVGQLLPHPTQAPKTVPSPVFKPAAKPVGTTSPLKHGK